MKKGKYPDEKRPKCTCGRPMQFIQYSGYYSTLFFWQCLACEPKEQGYEPDLIELDHEF